MIHDKAPFGRSGNNFGFKKWFSHEERHWETEINVNAQSKFIPLKKWSDSLEIGVVRGISTTPTQSLPQRTPTQKRWGAQLPRRGNSFKSYKSVLLFNSLFYDLYHPTPFKSCGPYGSWGNIKEAESSLACGILGDFIAISGCGPPSPGAAGDISVALHSLDFNPPLSHHYDNQGFY